MNREEEKQEILASLLSDSRVKAMQKFIQHGKVSTYEHCAKVAELSYQIDRRFALHSDLKVLLTGAMLHDFYLYDWHVPDDGAHRLHGFRHADTARENARKCFGVDERTGHVIFSHMWPLNIERIPRSREAWIVCMADKIISTYETLFRRRG